MKIGILTFHTPYNFGANLQAYASSHFFESLGHNVKIINYLIDGIIPEVKEGTQKYAHWNFSQNVLKVTRPCFTGKDIYDVVKEEQFNLVIVGSDAVWSKKNIEHLKVFYADWLWGTDLEGKVKVVAMSPAFMGKDYKNLTPENKKAFKDSLERFVYINTRDEWTRFVVNRDIMGYNFIKKINPDPVFLLDRFVEVKWQHPTEIEAKKYIIVSLPVHPFNNICFIRDFRENWMKRFTDLAHNNGLKVIELPLPSQPSGFKFDYIVPYPIDPLQWYLWLKNSAGFFGYRFHAIVACISSGTPFLSIDSYGNRNALTRILSALGIHRYDAQLNRSSKIRNLLEGSGLENQRFNTTETSFISPELIIDKLLHFDMSLLRNFQKEQEHKFETNMNEMLRFLNQ